MALTSAAPAPCGREITVIGTPLALSLGARARHRDARSAGLPASRAHGGHDASRIVQLFYLRREGFAVDGTPYAQRRLDRAEAVFGWLGKELSPDKCSFDGGLGLAEIALVSALD